MAGAVADYRHFGTATRDELGAWYGPGFLLGENEGDKMKSYHIAAMPAGTELAFLSASSQRVERRTLLAVETNGSEPVAFITLRGRLPVFIDAHAYAVIHAPNKVECVWPIYLERRARFDSVEEWEGQAKVFARATDPARAK